MAKLPVSAVLVVKNEELHLEECLQSIVEWVDDIVVVDDESTDKTVAIAQKYGARVFHRKLENEGIHRNWALDQAKHNWVLGIDGDEVVTPELAKEIAAALVNTDCNGFNIPRKNYIGDHWVQYGGWYPNSTLKLFQRSNFRYKEDHYHARVDFKGKAGHLKSDFIHYNYRDFAHYLAKLNNQTNFEAKKWFQDRPNIGVGWVLWRTVDRFFRALIIKKGYKDGMTGFMVAVFSAFYQVVSYAKFWEYKTGKKRLDA